MDPSIIIETAIPLKNIAYFVALSCILSIFTIWGCQRAILTRNEIQEQSHKYLNLMDNILLIGSATIFTQCSFILCGINYMKLPTHTFLSSLYVATNAVLPITLSAPSAGVIASLQHDKSRVNYKAVVAYLFGPISSDIKQSQQQKQQQHTMNRHLVQRMHQCSTLGTLIGMCVCAILRVLDHGMQIQRYPMPIIVGATAGRVCGVLLAVLVTVSSERQ